MLANQVIAVVAHVFPVVAGVFLMVNTAIQILLARVDIVKDGRPLAVPVDATQRRNRMKAALLALLKISLDFCQLMPPTHFVKPTAAIVTIVPLVTGNMTTDDRVQAIRIVVVVGVEVIMGGVVAGVHVKHIKTKNVAIVIIVQVDVVFVASVLIVVGDTTMDEVVQQMLIVEVIGVEEVLR